MYLENSGTFTRDLMLLEEYDQTSIKKSAKIQITIILNFKLRDYAWNQSPHS